MRDAAHLSKTKATFQLLCKMRARLNKDMIHSQDNTSNPDTLNVTSIVTSKSQESHVAVDPEEVCIGITGDCLFRHVEHKLKFGGIFSYTVHEQLFVYMVLKSRKIAQTEIVPTQAN